jgi:HEAT repeat protein
MRKFGVGIFSCAVLVAVLAAVLSASPPGGLNLQNLSHPDYHVRAAAVDRLVQDSGGRLFELLDTLAGESSLLEKAGLVEAIRKVGFGAEDLSSISLLLESRDPAVRRAAVLLLAVHPMEAYRDLCRVAEDPREVAAVRIAAVAALGAAGPQVRSTLLRLSSADSKPEAVRHEALRSLSRTPAIGNEDVAQVAADATRPWADRRVAIRALGDPQCPGTQLLVGLAASKEPRVRAAAAEAIAERGDANQGGTLANMLTDSWPDVRRAALHGLERLGLVMQNLAGVIGRLADADPRIVCEAARLIGAQGKPALTASNTTLCVLLASRLFPVRYAAAEALYRMYSKAGLATMQADAMSANPAQAATAAALAALIAALP